MNMNAQKIKINESIVNTYSYLRGNFSEDDFIISSENNSRFEIENNDDININFEKQNNFDVRSLCGKINSGVDEKIIEDLENGKFINFKFENKSTINVKNFLDGNFSASTFNIENNGDDSKLYFYSEILGDGLQFNHFYNVNLNGNSEATLVIFLNSGSRGFVNVLANCNDKSKLEILFVNINKNNVYTNCNVYLNGEGSSSDMDVCYICSEDYKFDYNLTSSMVGKKSNSNINGKGILLGNSKKIFRGTIDFKKGCSEAEGCENEEVIILSKNAKNQSLPLLLCDEKNVKGSHGFTANSIDNDKIFYLLSRGFSEKEARVLILKGKFLNILNKASNDEIIDKFIDVLLESI